MGNWRADEEELHVIRDHADRPRSGIRGLTMCGSAILGKPPKPVPPAQFQDSKSPEYDATSRSTSREQMRRGFASTILATMNSSALAPPPTTGTKSTLGA